MPQKLPITNPDGGIPLESVRRILERLDAETIDVTPEPFGYRSVSAEYT